MSFVIRLTKDVFPIEPCPTNNNLTSLPQLNEKLQILFCSHNSLTSLPPLNENLQKLICTFNNLRSLPPLNKNLQIFTEKHDELVRKNSVFRVEQYSC